MQEHKAMLPWYGAVHEDTCSAVSAVFWGGQRAHPVELADLLSAWAHLSPSRSLSTAMSTQASMCGRCGSDAAACGGCGSMVAAMARSPVGGSPVGSSPAMARAGSAYMSSGSLI